MAVTIIMELYDSFAKACRAEAKAHPTDPKYRETLSNFADLSREAYEKDMETGGGGE